MCHMALPKCDSLYKAVKDKVIQCRRCVGFICAKTVKSGRLAEGKLRDCEERRLDGGLVWLTRALSWQSRSEDNQVNVSRCTNSPCHALSILADLSDWVLVWCTWVLTWARHEIHFRINRAQEGIKLFKYEWYVEQICPIFVPHKRRPILAYNWQKT